MTVEEDDDWGQDGRVLALSDGVFAIAATLLALDIRVPEGLDTRGLHDALRGLAPGLTGYAIAFLVIGVLWLGHRELFGDIRRVEPAVAWVNVVLLGFVALLPFPSSLLADYGDEPVAVIGYAASVSMICALQLVIVALARRTGTFRAGKQALPAYGPSAVTIVGFVVSMPLALLSPRWAPACWLLLIPAHAIINRIEKRGDRGPRAS
ncbi:TMEM175 family protein [Saccharopolyspora sp. TS4A08]|uniref:TMEM175 family protein n=1 Tax=Saccharopolyspora ipomoeae TaxID=3042027 RepID=A0ABT6PNG9_9PSEU|nr:TMEM175 family protein [Saccharopolyspora sp. TS4A08]MDI2029554.1 TMEM175 family protein [Saccharopolyspora sp. TS4A08]